MWDSAFGKSPIIKWLKEQVDALLAAAGFTVELDLSAKIDKPSSFTSGNFATFDPATEELVDTGRNDQFYQYADPLKGLSANDFTDAYKTLLDNLPGELPDANDFMAKVEPTAGNLNCLTAIDATGQAIATTKKASGVFNTTENLIEAPTSYPTTRQFNCGIITGMAAAHIFYTLYDNAVATRKRAGQIIVLFNGTSAPENIGAREGISGVEITGNLIFTVESNELIANYIMNDLNYATNLNLQILIQ